MYRAKSINVFYCFAYGDQKLLDDFDKQLNILKQRRWIQTWDDRQVAPGMEREREAELHLQTAEIILLLISPDFFASPVCWNQMQQAMRRYEAGEAVVLPVILRPVDWQNTLLSKLHVLPENGKPIVAWARRDLAFFAVENGVEKVVKALLKGICITSTPADRALALQLQQGLEAQGLTVWNTSDAYAQHVPNREDIVRQIIRASQMIVLLTSPSTKNAPAIREELRIADMYDKRVVPVWVQGSTWQESVPLQLTQRFYIDARSANYEIALERIVTLHSSITSGLYPDMKSIFDASFSTGPLLSSASVLTGEPRNPYKALRAFDGEDVRDFFGRETVTNELIQALKELLPSNNGSCTRLLSVVGPSGVGKSSVVMAGLLPHLQCGALPGSDTWVYLKPMSPGARPVESLALVLSDYVPGESIKALHDELSDQEARGLYWRAFRLMKSRETKVVLVVDQFEELFTQPSEDERQHFINLLVTAVTEPQSPVVAIVTMRADFYDRPMSYPELRDLMQAHQKIVPPMEISDLRAVIEGPANLSDVQLHFDDGLVGDLLFDVRGQVGALPLLEFTLDQLFQRRIGQQLSWQAYKEIGGVKGALSKQAEETYSQLPSDEYRRLVRGVFLRLIDPGTTEQDTTRRRAKLSEFSTNDTAQTRMQQEMVEAFITARLLTTNSIAGTTTIEVSHETLIREWPRLMDWLREAREDLPLQQALSKDAVEWEQHDKLKDRLYRGSQLKEAKAWARRNIPSSNEVAFLQASTIRQTRSRVNIIAFVLLFLLVAGTAVRLLTLFLAIPSPTVVYSIADGGPGSLRQAIAAAKPGDTITFDTDMKGKTILLTSGDLHITQKNLTIRGLGQDNLTISSGNAGHSVFVDQGASVTISNLAFKGSRIVGFRTFIENMGTLTLNDITIAGNTVSTNDVSVGGISNGGTLTLNSSLVSGNDAFTNKSTEIGSVGGILNGGTLTLNNSSIFNNIASTTNSSSNSDAASFGGILSTGTLTLRNSSVSGNKASSDHTQGNGSIGGIYDAGSGKLTLENSTVSNNSASLTNYSGGIGGVGGIVNHGTFILSNSTISKNSVSTDGKGGGVVGGIYNAENGTFMVSNSTISGNTAPASTTSVGGILNIATFLLNSSTVSGNSAREGGGIFNLNTALFMMNNSTISGNMADQGGGGIFNYDAATFIMNNSTLSGNKAYEGGGIFNLGGKVEIIFCTLYSNKSTKGGGGIWGEDLMKSIGNVRFSKISVRNSIIAHNIANNTPNISGTITSDGYNLIGDLSGATFTSNKQHLTDLAGNAFTDLKISPNLQDNGGLTKLHTFTHKLLSSSPAIDAIPLVACRITINLVDYFGKPISQSSITITSDQRGMPRPDDNEQLCDIGAYESTG